MGWLVAFVVAAVAVYVWPPARALLASRSDWRWRERRAVVVAPDSPLKLLVGQQQLQLLPWQSLSTPFVAGQGRRQQDRPTYLPAYRLTCSALLTLPVGGPGERASLLLADAAEMAAQFGHK